MMLCYCCAGHGGYPGDGGEVLRAVARVLARLVPERGVDASNLHLRDLWQHPDIAG